MHTIELHQCYPWGLLQAYKFKRMCVCVALMEVDPLAAPGLNHQKCCLQHFFTDSWLKQAS